MKEQEWEQKLVFHLKVAVVDFFGENNQYLKLGKMEKMVEEK